MSDEDACAVCGGPRAEHTPDKSRHPYTDVAGDLKTWPAPQPAGPTPGMLRVPMGGESATLGRLVEVMLDKSLIDAPEALYIMGVGSKPKPKTFRDPSLQTLGSQI